MPDDREVKIKITADTSGLTSALAQAGDVSKTVADVQRTLADSASQVSSAYVRMRSSLDPAYAAQVKLDSACRTVNAELKRGAITSEEYAATANLITAALHETGLELTKTTAAFRAQQAIKERSIALEEAQAAAAEASTGSQVSALGKLMAQYRAMEAIKSRSIALEAAQSAAAEASSTAQSASLGQLMAGYRAAEAIKSRSIALEEAQAAAAEAASSAQIGSLGRLMAEYRAAEAIKTRSIALEEAQAAAAEASASAQLGSLAQLMAEYRATEAIKANSLALEEAQAAAAETAHAAEMASLRDMMAEYQRAEAIKTKSLALEQAQVAELGRVASAQTKVVAASAAAAQRLEDYGAKISRSEQLTRQYNTALERLRVDATAAGLSESAIAAEVARLDAALAAGMANIAKYGEHAHSGFSSILRELLVVGHEAMTGRFSRIPGSLVVLAEYATRTAAAFLPMAIAIGAVGFAVYEAVAAFERFEVAVNRAMAGVRAQTGGGGFSRELFAGFIDQLDHMAGVSKTAAEEVIVSLSHIRTATPAALADAVAGMEGFIAVTGEKAPQAAQQLAEAMKSPVEAMEKWIDEGLRVDAQTLLNVNTLQQLGRMSEATALALKTFGEAGRQAAGDLTPIQKGTRDFENAVLDLGHAFGVSSSAGGLWGSVLHALTEAIRLLTPVAQAIGFVLRELFDILTVLFDAFTNVAAVLSGTVERAFLAFQYNLKIVAATARLDFTEASRLIAEKAKAIGDSWTDQAKRLEDASKSMRAAARDAVGLAPETGPQAPGTDPKAVENAERLIEIGTKYASQKRDLARITEDMFRTDVEINRVSALISTADEAHIGVLQKQLAILIEMRQSENAAYDATLKREQPAPKGQASQIEEFKAELAEQRNATSEFHEFSNADEAQFWRDKLKIASEGGKEIAEITKLLNDADRRSKEDVLRATLDAMKNELANANLSFAEKSRILIEYTKLADASYVAGSKAFVAAKDFEVKTQARIEQEKLALVLRGIDAQNKADERRTAAISTALDAQVKLGLISADEAERGKDTANNAMLANEVNRIQREIDANVGGEKVKEGLEQQLVVANDKANEAILRSAEKSLELEQVQYKQAFSRIASSISSSLMDVLKGTATWSQGMMKFAEGLTDDFIRSTAEIATNWLRTEVIKTTETATQTRARELIEAVSGAKSTQEITAIVARYNAGQIAQTGAASSGAAARNAIGASENSSFLGRIVTAIAQWLGLESDKTGATAAGETERETAQLTAAAVARGAAVDAGFAQIEIEASIAAAAAFADTASLGPYGLAAAPEAATAAYGATMAWAAGMGGGVALATGAWEIPRTMQATLHEGETVVPASFASGLRQSGVLGGGGGGGDTYHLTIQAVDTQSGAQFIQMHARAIVTALRAQVRNGTPMPGFA